MKLRFFTIMRRSFLVACLGWLFPNRVRSQPDAALLDTAEAALAKLIAEARQEAIAAGVRPIPPNIYRGLLGYFPSSLLERCRFAVGAIRPFSLPGLAFAYGDAAAMTLGEVVLFKSDIAARSDLKMWAHELTHVMQYQRWGIDGFAARYVRDDEAVEREAIDNADRFGAWRHAA